MSEPDVEPWTSRQAYLMDAGLCARMLFGGYCVLVAHHGGDHVPGRHF